MTGPKDPLLILLVGSNPLPNYLSACALRPRRIALLYTKETMDAKDRLKRELNQALGNAVSFVDPDPFVEDATCATTLQRVIEHLISGEVWLNYTGGTKVMAAHARIVYQKHDGKAENASYLDEGGTEHQPRLRFDDGNSKPLFEYPDVPLKLATVLGLHGITHTLRTPMEPAPTIDDARVILCKVLQDVPLANALYSERERLEKHKNPKKFLDEPFRADRHGLTLSLLQVPDQNSLDGLKNAEERESWFKQWYKFIGGEWLEKWIGEQIRQLALDPTPATTVGFDAFRGSNETQLEIDVAVVRGHRSYFISCTTDTTKPICKSKLFEVAVRSRQLGGDLARAALVCLADDKSVSGLKADIDALWGASNTIRVFGFSDIKSWSECGGTQPNRDSLKTWLES